MRKISAILVAALVAISPLKADEGMWLLPLLEKMNIKTMQEMGCKLSAEDIYSVNHSSIKDAVVHFGGGCTAEVISPNGLIVTNHHCGYGAIQQLSSVEHNYLEDGYWAMNLEEELPAKGLTVTFLESFTDVTKAIEKGVKKAKNAQERDSLYQVTVKKLTDKVEKGNKYVTARVYSMYSGNAYYLVVSKTFKDIRFVGAPPSSIGKFGADTDNWVWPRHTCDFSMFRIYADKDNNPAEYSEDNVPYQAKRHLTISLKGVEPNGFTMIIGYPGRTNRYMTQSEVEEQIMKNEIAIHARGVRQDVLMEDMLADPKIKIQYASKYSGSSNGWKKYIGMNETFEKLNVPERRAQQEAEFTEWYKESKKRTARYENTLAKIDGVVEDRADLLYDYTYIAETVSRIELVSVALSAARSGRSLEQFYKNYSLSTDIKVAKAMIKILKEKVAADALPSFVKEVDEKFGGDVDAYVDNLYATSKFTTLEGAQAAIKDGSVEEDPAYKIGESISASILPYVNCLSENRERFNEGKKEYTKALLEMKDGAAIYPDANSTMRLTYGQVLPYSPKDAVVYNYYTTLEGVMEKEDPNNWEFVVPEKLKELYAAKDYGQYAMPNGEMPACFITNGDITGGNSGSPVLNDKGELIGLAFDGNWEAMSGDIIFEPSLQRCINVDIRYVLFIVDKFGGAGYLLDEMTIVR